MNTSVGLLGGNAARRRELGLAAHLKGWRSRSRALATLCCMLIVWD